ncbi:MAG: RHS repeat-associated core domain-containing protein [Eubacteriales bacterium]
MRFYEKNLQNDVTGIYGADGTKVAAYAYNAWGKVLSVVNYTDDHVGTINPFRYRSYYYDTETGMYYLQTRYYDPEVGRFINSDALEYLGEGPELLNYNLFAYCGNNPTMAQDSTGTSIKSWWNNFKKKVSSTWSSIKKWASDTKEWLDDNFLNDDGSYSLYDNDRHRNVHPWHEQLFVVTPSGPSLDLNKFNVGLGSIELDAYTGGWEWEDANLSLFDFGHVETAAEIKNGEI